MNLPERRSTGAVITSIVHSDSHRRTRRPWKPYLLIMMQSLVRYILGTSQLARLGQIHALTFMTFHLPSLHDSEHLASFRQQ
jgi:hypothetical protein